MILALGAKTERHACIQIFMVRAVCIHVRPSARDRSSMGPNLKTGRSLFFYIHQLFLAVAARPPIPHTAHLRDRSSGSIGYSYEVRPTFRLLPWPHGPFHPHTALPVHNSLYIDIRPATVKAVCATLYSPEASLLQQGVRIIGAF